jgi:hypothetical protein
VHAQIPRNTQGAGTYNVGREETPGRHGADLQNSDWKEYGEQWNMVYISDRIRKAHPQRSRSTLGHKHSRLEIKRQFFSQRVEESWNKIPASLKQSKNVKCFKNGYRTLRDTMVENT